MYRQSHWRQHESEDQVADRQTASLAAIVVVLLLLVGGLFLVQQLRAAGVVQDCLLSGRHGCVALVTGDS